MNFTKMLLSERIITFILRNKDVLLQIGKRNKNFDIILRHFDKIIHMSILFSFGFSYYYAVYFFNK